MNAAATGVPSLFPFVCLASGALLILFLDALAARSRRGLGESDSRAGRGGGRSGVALGLGKYLAFIRSR